MNIAVIGRGNVGGGLANLWRAAGHDVQELGKDGGDVSGADVVLVAVPSGQIADALGKVTGLDGKVVVDATNHFQGERPDFPSLAHQVKSITGGAGYDPIDAGDLENARKMEDTLPLLFAVSQATGGPVFYRIAPPGAL